MAPTAQEPHGRRRPRLRLVALVAIFAMLLTACGTGFDNVTDATASSDDSGAMDAAEESFDAMEDADESAVSTGESAPAAQPADGDLGTSGNNAAAQRSPAELGRQIIFTATVNVGVDDVAASGAEATEIIQDLDGFVFGQETQGGAQPRTVLVFKVRPSDFDEALRRLGGIGELRNQSISTDDVTERVVDLESRIQTTELGVERLRTAMENTTNLEDFARLEEQLLRRESDLEVLKGTLRTLRDQIDLATITLTLEQDRVDNAIEVRFSIYEGHDDGAGCPGVDNNSFDPGDEITLCFEAINLGDQTLTNLNITDTVLEIDGIDELTTVFGDPNDIQPGQSVVLAYELKAERDVQLRMAVTATPTDGTSAEAAGPAVRSQVSPRVRVDESAADPGFGDGFGAAVAFLSVLWTLAKLLVGFLIPMLIILVPVAWLLRRLFAARRAKRAERVAAQLTATQPPPPAPAPAEAPSEPSADDE